MTLHNIYVPLYDCSGEDKEHKLIIDEFAGRMSLTVQKGDIEIIVECYFDDLQRAWYAVKRY